VFNTPGANANAVKELTLAALFLASRGIIEGSNWVQGLKGCGNVETQMEKGKAAFGGHEIADKAIGVIGLGAIGIQVANACYALGMTVYGYDPYLSVDSAWRLSRWVVKAADMREIFRKCDYITIHVPLTPEARHMIGHDAFLNMKKGVTLINIARGDLVDNEALLEAVKTGKVERYVTDFPSEDLLGVQGIITIPHLGASTKESEDNCARAAAHRIVDFLEYGNIKDSVNFPECELAYTGKQRLCITHQNVPRVVSSVTAEIGEAGLNIDNMINKSRDKVAYTIIDLDSGDLGEIVSRISAMEAILKVRCI